MKIKTVIEFSLKGDIEKTISKWAKKSIFQECSRTSAEEFVDYDNVTYCYCSNIDGAKMLISIHQLDNKVRIEAWIAEEIRQKQEFVQSIYDLLNMLGQDPDIKQTKEGEVIMKKDSI